jgi:hypothetical protein
MTGITQAALAERNAENTRNQALATWRAAWWETTMVLSAVPNESARAAINQAGVILGHSNRYLGQRRLLGQRLARYALTEVRGLPPRLAMLYILSVKADPARIHEVLEDAQKRNLSLRDLARELGSQPDSWKRQGERNPAHYQTEAGAVISALDNLAKAVTALAAASEPADPVELARVAERAENVRPSVDWLVTLRKRVSAA